MTHSVNADDILRDIEFELAQGAILRDELGEAVWSIRQFYNKTRSEFFKSARRMPDSRTIASRQFQIADMLITLAQELAAAIQAIQLDMRRLARLPLPAQTAEPGAAPPVDSRADSTFTAADWPSLALDEIDAAMRAEALAMEPVVMPSRLPLVGGLVTRLKFLLFHLAPLDYTRRLAERQVKVNQIYGEWVRRLSMQNHQQDAQIRMLNERLAELEMQLAARAERAGSSGA